MLLWIKKKHIWKKKGDCAGNPSTFLLAIFPLFVACIWKEETVVFLSNNCVTLWYQFEFKKTPASPAFTYVSHLFWLLVLFLSLSLSSPLSLSPSLSPSLYPMTFIFLLISASRVSLLRYFLLRFLSLEQIENIFFGALALGTYISFSHVQSFLLIMNTRILEKELRVIV